MIYVSELEIEYLRPMTKAASILHVQKEFYFFIQVREQQPEKQAIKDFFEARHLDNNSHKAVLWCIEQRAQNQLPITWLTCTMRGAAKVNAQFMSILGTQRGED